jgi:hypothetical protein
MTKFLRKAHLAVRYGITQRSVDRWSMDGRLPSPEYRGRIPLWSEAELDKFDRRLAAKSRKSEK